MLNDDMPLAMEELLAILYIICSYYSIVITCAYSNNQTVQFGSIGC